MFFIYGESWVWKHSVLVGFCVTCLSSFFNWISSVSFYFISVIYDFFSGNRFEPPCSLSVSFLLTYQDKWRNLSVSTTGQGSKEKSRAPKIKAITAAPIPNVQNSAPAAPLRRNASPDTVMDDAPNSTQEGKNAPR